VNPATEEVIANVQEAGEADVNLAVAAAREAFDNGPWRRMTPRDRGILMFKLVDLLQRDIEEITRLEALDSGKPVSFAGGADIPIMINCFRYYAGWADKLHGTTVPMNGPFVMHTRKEPVGVCG
jgi:aldehyde dehydrogenase (NAD+)